MFFCETRSTARRRLSVAAPIVDLGIVWHAENVSLTFMSGERAVSVCAASANRA